MTTFTRHGGRRLEGRELRDRLRNKHFEITDRMKSLPPEKAYRYFEAANRLWAARQRLLDEL